MIFSRYSHFLSSSNLINVIMRHEDIKKSAIQINLTCLSVCSALVNGCVGRLWEEFVFPVSSGVLPERQCGHFSSHRSHGGPGASPTVRHSSLTSHNIIFNYIISRFFSTKSRCTILSRFFVMLVWLFCKLSEQYSQTNFPILKNKALQGNKI